MFERIGHFATRYRYPIILAWVLAAVVITVLAPNIDDVASSDQADFLPDDAPFARANEVYKATFPDSYAPGSSAIVIDARGAPDGVLNGEAEAFADQIDTPTGRFIDAFVAWLNSEDGPENILSVIAPTMSPATAGLMVAPGNDVAIVRVNLTTSNPEEATAEALHAIDAWLIENRPDTVKTYQTGEAPIINNTTESIKTSVDRTIWVTIVLVVVLLLVIYRSPVSPLIPLSAVTVAYLIARGIVAYLGDNVMTITSYVNVMVVVVMYGAGTDYCLFLISRFREELADYHNVRRATAETVGRVGETITSSAGTIFVGFMAMVFAEMGVFNTSGPALAIGIVLSLLAGLTFVPALLATLGERAFWPRPAMHRATGRFYGATSQFVSARPLVTVIVICAILLPLAVYGVKQRASYDLLGDLPSHKDSVVGYRLMQDTLGAGAVMPLTIVVTGRDPQTVAADIVRLTGELAILDGVEDVRGMDTPLGLADREYAGLLRVDQQLRMAQGMMAGLQDAGSVDVQEALAALEAVQDYLDLLAERFPEVADDPNLATLRDLLANPLQLMARQDELGAALDGLATRFESVEEPYLLPLGLANLLSELPGDGGDVLGQLAATYLANEGAAFKLDVVVSSDADSYEAMDTVTTIRSVLKGYQGDGDAVVSGGWAINADIRDTMNRDLIRAIGFVLLGIFIVLLIMLRSVIAPLYLIATVVFSFTFTVGLTNVVMRAWLGVEGLTWYVPFFIFVMLVGLGVDYSIFLIGRVKEEIGYHGIREGVHVAVAATGAIITSAGVILAGTFAAMISGEIKGLVELGFAVAVGILIDTFVVRTMLVPAITILLGRWAWWPGGVPKARPRPVAPQEDALHAGD